jgi:hypothetical protein
MHEVRKEVACGVRKMHDACVVMIEGRAPLNI